MTGNKGSSSNVMPAGSPSPGEPVFLVVGKLRRPHGIRGEMTLEVMTDFPERLKTGKTVFVGETHLPLKIRSIRGHQKGLLVAFRDYVTPEAVGELRNELVYVKVSSLPELPDGEYYHHQVIGLRVEDEEGVVLGQISDILSTGANDVFIVRQENGKEFLLPAIESMLLSIDLEKGVVLARPLPGLIPEE